MDKLELLKQRIDKFNKDRDWDKFHSPSNLSKSISIEANELLECFQWNDNEYDVEQVKEELADVLKDAMNNFNLEDFIYVANVKEDTYPIKLKTKTKIIHKII